jgi:outer membrane biosynthesis protein TonB
MVRPTRLNVEKWLVKGTIALTIAGLAGCTDASSTAPPMARPPVQTIYTHSDVDSVSHNYNYNYNDSHSTSTSVSHVYIHQDINAHPGGVPLPSDNGSAASAAQWIEQRQPDVVNQGNHPEEEDQANQQPPAQPEPPAPEEQPPQAEPASQPEPQAAEPPAPEPEPQVAEPPAPEPPPSAEEPPAEPSSPPDSGSGTSE